MYLPCFFWAFKYQFYEKVLNRNIFISFSTWCSRNRYISCNFSGIQFQGGPRPQKSFVSKRGVLLLLSIRAWTIDCTVGQHTFPAFSSLLLINFGVMFSVYVVQWWAWAISAAAACLLFLRDPGPRSRLRWCFWLERPPYWEEHISLLIITLVQGTNFDLQAPNQSIGTRDNQLWSSIMDHQHD